MSDVDEAAPPAAEDVRRLSPRVLAIRPLHAVRPLIVPLLVVLVVNRLSTWTLVGAIAAAAYSIAISLVHWIRFTYRLDATSLRITRGLIDQTTLMIPLDRVRGVDLTSTALHRVLGLTVVRIDSAAHQRADEGVLDAVTMAEAQRLRDEVLRRRGREAAAAAQAASDGAAPEPVLARLDPRWILYAPLAGDSLVALVAVGGRLLGEFSRDIRVSDNPVVHMLVAAAFHTPALALGGVLVLVVLASIVTTAWFAVVNWDFTLRARDGSLVVERGLLTRRSASLERRRVRGWELFESPLERLANVARLRAVVAGRRRRADPAMLLPIGPRPFVLDVAARAVCPFVAPLVPHPPRGRNRRLVRAVVPPLVLAAATVPTGVVWVPVACLVLAALGVPLALDRYRSLGHAWDGRRVSVREGSLRRRQFVVEQGGIVGWRIRQSWFQRRIDLMTLDVAVGAGRGAYAAVDVNAGEAVRFAGEVTPAWIAPLLAEPPGRE